MLQITTASSVINHIYGIKVKNVSECKAEVHQHSLFLAAFCRGPFLISRPGFYRFYSSKGKIPFFYSESQDYTPPSDEVFKNFKRNLENLRNFSDDGKECSRREFGLSEDELNACFLKYAENEEKKEGGYSEEDFVKTLEYSDEKNMLPIKIIRPGDKMLILLIKKIGLKNTGFNTIIIADVPKIINIFHEKSAETSSSCCNIL